MCVFMSQYLFKKLNGTSQLEKKWDRRKGGHDCADSWDR